jgi:hypothetical protein
VSGNHHGLRGIAPTPLLRQGFPICRLLNGDPASVRRATQASKGRDLAVNGGHQAPPSTIACAFCRTSASSIIAPPFFRVPHFITNAPFPAHAYRLRCSTAILRPFAKRSEVISCGGKNRNPTG